MSDHEFEFKLEISTKGGSRHLLVVVLLLLVLLAPVVAYVLNRDVMVKVATLLGNLVMPNPAPDHNPSPHLKALKFEALRVEATGASETPLDNHPRCRPFCSCMAHLYGCTALETSVDGKTNPSSKSSSYCCNHRNTLGNNFWGC